LELTSFRPHDSRFALASEMDYLNYVVWWTYSYTLFAACLLNIDSINFVGFVFVGGVSLTAECEFLFQCGSVFEKMCAATQKT